MMYSPRHYALRGGYCNYRVITDVAYMQLCIALCLPKAHHAGQSVAGVYLDSSAHTSTMFGLFAHSFQTLDRSDQATAGHSSKCHRGRTVNLQPQYGYPLVSMLQESDHPTLLAELTTTGAPRV